MLEKIQALLIAKKIELVKKVIADHMTIDSVGVNGTELCEEECEALRAGVVAGLATARAIVNGDHSEDLEVVATQAYDSAARAYGRYLKEAQHAEE